MALGLTLFEFERPVLIQNSRNKSRVYLIHRYRHGGPNLGFACYAKHLRHCAKYWRCRLGRRWSLAE